MEAEQARELALNARLDHWPPHLGVKTDAEKIEHLATRLDETATAMFINEGLDDENKALQEENEMLKSEVDKLQHKLDKIREIVGGNVQD